MIAYNTVPIVVEVPGQLRLPRITSVRQADGTVWILDWDAALNALDGPDPARPYSDTVQRAAMIRVLSDAYARFRLGEGMYETLAKELEADA